MGQSGTAHRTLMEEPKLSKLVEIVRDFKQGIGA